MTKTILSPLLKVAAAAFVIAFGTSDLGAQIIANGNFESPLLPPTETSSRERYTGPYGGLSPTAIEGWLLGNTVTTGANQSTVSVRNTSSLLSNIAPYEGAQYVALGALGSISQIISLDSGSYRFSIAALSRPNYPENPIQVTLNGNAITFSNSNTFTAPIGTWAVFTSDDIAISNSGDYTLVISGVRTIYEGETTIDAVSMTAVPEPGSLALVALSLCGYAVARLRRRVV